MEATGHALAIEGRGCKLGASPPANKDLKHLELSPSTAPEPFLHTAQADAGKTHGSKAPPAEIRLPPSVAPYWRRTMSSRHWTKYGRRSSQKRTPRLPRPQITGGSDHLANGVLMLSRRQ